MRSLDIHLNPKSGVDWQVREKQKRVVTPGQNEKYYLAGRCTEVQVKLVRWGQ